jgi:predicted nucleic acid-binding protein
MSDRVFIDTNVFVYADDGAARTKQVQARSVLSELIRGKRAVVSTQIMQEYFAAAIRKLGLSPDRARVRVERLNRLDVILVRPELILGAIDLCRLHDLSFWDALVLRSASAAGCGRLLTEDLQHGRTIDGDTIENPFR